jgi:DNA-binding IclR family transcriptional regulator
VEAVLAALDVLDCFLEEPVLTLRQLSEKTGMTRNRVTRLAGTLSHRGYLLQERGAGGFTPGPRLMSLGQVFDRNRNLAGIARPVLQRLALATGESVTLYVREGLERVVLAREEGTHAIRFAVSEGQRMDLQTGASGKVLLAHAPEAVVGTITGEGSRRLKDELGRVRRRGYATSTGERVADAAAIAVPVFGAGGVVGALGIAGPVSRFTEEVLATYRERILEAAEELSRLLGWRGGGAAGP